jgi:diaminopimelate epimerase
MHGNGNDFIMIDGRNLLHNALPWEEISRRVCDRRLGVGADQVLLLDSPPQKDLDAKMLIYDADGSQVEMCGNGLRALALYLWQEKICQKEMLKIATMERVVRVERLAPDRFRVDMGEPILDGSKIPVKADGKIINHSLSENGKNYPITCVSMGNPHAVIYIDEKVKDYPVTLEGPALEINSFFPNRVNVEFVEVLSPHEVNARVWERGTGETLACGSGACAIAVAGVLTKRTQRNLKINLPGGLLELEWREKDNHVFLTGNAQRVFEGDIDLMEVFQNANG